MRLLVFSTLPPVPINRGDKNRLFHIINLLKEFADVQLVYLERDWEKQEIELNDISGIKIDALVVRKHEVILRGIRGILSLQPYIAFRFGLHRLIVSLQKIIEDWRPDAFFGFGIAALPFLQHIRGMRCVLDLVDSPSMFINMVKASKKMDLYSRLSGIIQWRLKHYENLAISLSDHVLVSSRRDKEHLCRLHGYQDKIHILENCVPSNMLLRSWQPNSCRLPSIIFVGNMSYGPNRSAVEHFLRRIFPTVKGSIPQVEFILCGHGSKELLKKLGQPPGVRALGFVDDLVSLYLNSSIAVVPVPLAGGPQFKLIEAMALGVPIVASREVAEVIGVTDGKELLIGDTDEKFSSCIIAILKDPGMAVTLSRNMRAFILANHVWESKKSLLYRLFNS